MFSDDPSIPEEPLPAPVPAVVDRAPDHDQLLPDRHSVPVSRARLTVSSWRVMRTVRETAAQLLTDGRAEAARVPWWALHSQQLTALRAKPIEPSYAPAMGHRSLAAVQAGARGILASGARAFGTAGARV